MVLNICNFIQRTEQVPIELDISAIEDYILLLLYVCVRDMMDVVFYVCIVRRGAVGARV